ncbi:hypothetical protein VVD49_15800 [Uliginosibacterium sp. H3]|uniref:DUF1574 domain-containing protein n=1 Tax=Uliginosibacterium silvisoli TaxID=3114758 RepID=A0ABU6K821_9RHOO|nr:hypothetical protein [Uliginosibacterium sp. H3]
MQARESDPRLFLTIFVAALLLSLAAIWLYVVYMPMRFLETGYVSWTAKMDLAKTCDMGDLVVIGDSQAEAAINPLGLSVKSTNLAVGGATPIEMYYWGEHVLRCPNVPRHVMLTMARGQMGLISNFLFENGARYGYIGFGPLQEIQTESARLHDGALERLHTRDGLNGTLRNAFYAMHAPPLYFNSLISARFNGRAQANTQVYDRLLRNRGHNDYPGQVQNAGAGAHAEEPDFKVLPIQAYYLERLIERLEGAGAQVHFLVMPRRGSGDEQHAGQQDARFNAYLVGLQRQHPHFDVVNGVPAIWPDALFSDAAHLNPAGTERYTAQFEHCVKLRVLAGPAAPAAACDFTSVVAGNSLAN